MEDAVTKNIMKCEWCGKELPSDHSGPCPKCGKEGKNHKVETTVTIKATASSIFEHHREFIEKNPKLYWPILIFTFGFPLIGIILPGIITSILGWFLGIATFFLSPYAIKKIKEIYRQSGS